jgi:type III pantothenate kinase
MQSGLYFGYVGLVSNIIEEIKRELGTKAGVISTGGFAAQISHEVKSIDFHEPYLALEGLRILHERSRE